MSLENLDLVTNMYSVHCVRKEYSVMEAFYYVVHG